MKGTWEEKDPNDYAVQDFPGGLTADDTVFEGAAADDTGKIRVWLYVYRDALRQIRVEAYFGRSFYQATADSIEEGKRLAETIGIPAALLQGA